MMRYQLILPNVLDSRGLRSVRELRRSDALVYLSLAECPRVVHRARGTRTIRLARGRNAGLLIVEVKS